MALCAGTALFIGAAVAASAQSSPAPQASPAGQTMPGPGSNPGNPNPSGGQASAPRAAPAMGHLPVIDIVTTFTQPAYYGSNANIKNYDPVDVGGTVRFPITRKLNLFFDRITEGTLNQPLDCIQIAGVPERTCPNDSRDVILQYHGTYQFDRHWTLDVGDSFRHREFNSGASGVSAVPYPFSVSSTEHHYGYAGLSYTTSPIAELLHTVFVFSFTGDAQNVDHHVGALCTAGNKATFANNGLPASCGTMPATAVGFFDENPHQSVYYESTQGVSAIIPIDPKHGTSFLLNERWGALNFYENPTLLVGGIGIPYRWNSALTYQLNKRFSPGFTLSVRHSDYHAIPGMALPAPNAIHVGSWDVIGTFHVDTNSWFH